MFYNRVINYITYFLHSLLIISVTYHVTHSSFNWIQKSLVMSGTSVEHEVLKRKRLLLIWKIANTFRISGKNSIVASFSLKEFQQRQGCDIWLVSFALFLRPATNISHKQFVKARPAVWLPSLLLEDALAELPQTEGAHKVLGVKLAIESRDAAARDGLAAAATQSALPGVEVQWAEGSTVHLHETAVSERLHTVLGRL